MSVHRDRVEPSCLGLLENIQPKGRNRQAKGVKLARAARGISKVAGASSMDLLYQDALPAQDECVLVPLNMVGATIGRESRGGGHGKCRPIPCRIRGDPRDRT
jgi:hypothetical protein